MVHEFKVHCKFGTIWNLKCGYKTGPTAQRDFKQINVLWDIIKIIKLVSKSMTFAKFVVHSEFKLKMMRFDVTFHDSNQSISVTFPENLKMIVSARHKVIWRTVSDILRYSSFIKSLTLKLVQYFFILLHGRVTECCFDLHLLKLYQWKANLPWN